MGRLVKITAALGLTLLVGCASHPSVTIYRAEEPLRFVQPRASVVLSGMTGVEIPVQLIVERHSENRALEIAWNGPTCAGRSVMQLDAEFAERLQPPMKAAKIRMGPGKCEIAASVFGPGGRIRHRRTFVMTVCGGAESCGGDK